MASSPISLRSDASYQAIMKVMREKDISLVRFGDGEFRIVMGKSINWMHRPGFVHKQASGWNYKQEKNETERQALITALLYKNDNYVVASYASFAPHYGKSITTYHFGLWLDHAKQIYEEWPMLFRDRKVVVVSHEKTRLNHVLFSVEKHLPVPPDYWTHADLMGEQIQWARLNPGRLWLISAGPGANILIHKLHSCGAQGMFLDMGSVLDPMLGLGLTRIQSRQDFFLSSWWKERHV